MSIAENQHRLLEAFGGIPDRQERLAAVVDWAKKSPLSRPGLRTSAHRIAGCVSPVWVSASREGPRFSLACDADSPVVKGLVSLLCSAYQGSAPEEIFREEPTILDQLDLLRDLSPTRRYGLDAVKKRIRELAASCVLQP